MVVSRATPIVTLDIRFLGHSRGHEMFTPVLKRLTVELSIPVPIGFRAPDFQHVS